MSVNFLRVYTVACHLMHIFFTEGRRVDKSIVLSLDYSWGLYE